YKDGATPEEAATQAAKTRLRPILMTSFAFILGVAPLTVASGAGSEMRQSLGTARGHGFRPRVYARLLHSHSQARHQEGRMIQNLQPIVNHKLTRTNTFQS